MPLSPFYLIPKVGKKIPISIIFEYKEFIFIYTIKQEFLFKIYTNSDFNYI